MIKVENIFAETFNGLAVDGNDPLFFHYGNQSELDTVITLRDENQKRNYPLLWYLMPNQLSVKKGQYAQGNCRFVLANNTDDEWLNDQRFDKIFNAVLHPCFEAICSAIDKSGGLEMLPLSSGQDYDYTNYPNYGSPSTFEGNEQAKQINYWDAIGFTMNLRIYDEFKC